MITTVAPDELYAVLAQFNPWWRGNPLPELPSWHRAAWFQLHRWVAEPPAPRAILVSGLRQVGKTTLLLQSIERLLRDGVPAANILYVTFDHPLIKLAGIDAVLSAWRQRDPKQPGPEYLFLDEAQFMRDWAVWIKHQVDFSKNKRRIVFTGSATPLLEGGQESGVGRWHSIRLSTLSFWEYLRIRKLDLPRLPTLRSLQELFRYDEGQYAKVQEAALPYIAHFHEYIVRGGFPQTAQMASITEVQRLLREDIIDKVLKRDMTALFGVRRIVELEYMFLYLCINDGGLLDIQSICENLHINRPTVQNYLQLLEATNLVFRMLPYGYGKEVLRARYKVYLADACIAPAVMLKGRNLIDDPRAMGIATETAVFKHLYSRYYAQQIRFSYWRGKRDLEVDLLAELGGHLIPFEVKYRERATGKRELKGLLQLCAEKQMERAYIVTKSLTDFGPLKAVPEDIRTEIMRVPAPLLCYWMGEGEAVEDPSAA
ncbi:ATPase [Bryobacterales bacterium F-183]|nr:ATPase [Bryobacterales bacterium F-183]